MSINEQLLARVEALRIPLEDDTSPIDWKDWYHFVLLDRNTGLRVLVNLNMSGRPGQGEIQTSFLVNQAPSQLLPNLPSHHKTFGVAFSQEWKSDMVSRDPLYLQGKDIHLEINGKNSNVTVENSRTQQSIRFQGTATASPILVTEDETFGSGFIGWGIVPGLEVVGELSVFGQNFPINQDWFCYHDHNFGRFRWGDDIGWEWLVAFATCDDGRELTFILDRRTNKDHSEGNLPYIFIYLDRELRKIFLGSTLNLNWDWSPSPILPVRLPGIMASLFADRSITAPQNLRVEAADEQDSLSLVLNFDSLTELIVPDNQQQQYTFIEEVTGTVEVNFSIGGENIKAKGLVYGEYVV